MADTVTVPKKALTELLERLEDAIRSIEGEFPWDMDEERRLADELRTYVNLPPMAPKA